MGEITPFNQQSPEQWRHQNEEVLQKIHDDALKGIINGVLNLHELEQTGEWKHLGRRLDYSNLTYEIYIFTITQRGPLKILDCLRRLYLNTLTS